MILIAGRVIEMTFENTNIISDYCQNHFIRNCKSDTLLIFLPAVNGKEIYPYYPRKSWGVELSKDFNVLYISDPYQPLSEYRDSMGSWFISSEGVSTLEILAEKIKKFMIEISVKNIIFYGSSMGGYAAIVLSSLIENSKAIAECPQTYLNKHPGSRFVCEKILRSDIPISSIEPLHFLKNGRQKSIHIVCSIFDRHYEQHVVPFLEDIKNSIEQPKFDLTTTLYMSCKYKKGHIALQKDEAFSVINRVANDQL